MERIKLSKNEKVVLRLVAHYGLRPKEYPEHKYNAGIRQLTQKGLVKSLYQEGGDLVDIIITDQGEQYMAENPKLTNPVNWAAVATIISVIGVLVSIATLFVSCV